MIRIPLFRAAGIAVATGLLLGACRPSVTVGAGYQPPVAQVKFEAVFAIHPDGSISVGGSIGLVTEIGTFSIAASVETNMSPKPDETILIIRHQANGQLADTVYRIGTGEEITIAINGQTVLDVLDRKIIVDASKARITSLVVRNAGSLPSLQGPQITRVETYQQGVMVYFRLYYVDPDHDAEGFGFVGVNGSGWAAESHPFSSPSYGRVGPGRIDYPFNSLCGTSQAYSSDVRAWIYDTSGVRSRPVVVHLACAS